MKIAFLGDSITEGVPGVSYVDIIKNKLPLDDISNFGKGGDTVSSLKRRIDRIENLNQFDVIVLFVGVNDVFGKMTFQYKLLKLLMRQKWSKGKIAFEEDYKTILDSIQTNHNKIIVVTPLLIGEDLTNKWNMELSDYVSIIDSICKNHKDIQYLDIRSGFINYLSDKSISDFLPIKLTLLLKDVKELKTDFAIDARSNSRKLHLTLDGVHINSKGANMIAKGILNAISNMSEIMINENKLNKT